MSRKAMPPGAKPYSAMPRDSMIETPCVQVCVIEPATGLCAGCGRTMAEIGRWTAFTAEQRRAIMSGLGRRLADARPRAAG